MKKYLFGLIVLLLSTAVLVFNYIDAVLNPCSYNGIESLEGAFLAEEL
ncbi:MAG: hypothetical protein VB078_05820 [Clostridiaceae bacterium]|nr:hypothetical protein [Clostridiaceae bacterium]